MENILEDKEMITLNKHEKILAVVPEYCAGPGYGYWVVWVHILDYSKNTYRLHILQESETTPAMGTLFAIGATVSDALLSAVPTKKGKK